jgi:ABC-2 type transport system permease protein
LGLSEELSEINITDTTYVLKLIYSPVIQINYAQSIEQMIFALNKKLSTSYLLNSLSNELDLGDDVLKMDTENVKELITQKSTFKGVDTTIPNASQHNVPAWSIFAVFFMVISLAVNLVKEKINGSFDRVLTMPSSIWYLLGSKALLFWMVSLFQVLFIFTLSRFLFQFIGLPTLFFPDNILGFMWAILLTGITAVNYSLVIGVYSKTVEQANGFGALSVIIFSAIGGIWVPSFIMPPFLKLLSNVSPLHWCIELFYTIFLKNGSFNQILIPSLVLIVMNAIFVLLAYLKLKRLNIIVK